MVSEITSDSLQPFLLQLRTILSASSLKLTQPHSPSFSL